MAREPYVDERFSEDVGREIGDGERGAIENYINGVYTPYDHNVYFEGIADNLEKFKGPVADFVRMTAWTFLATWTQRSGGLSAGLNKTW